MSVEAGFPPLTSLDEYPLHGWDYGDQYACQRPEDPDCVTFDWRCYGCVLAAKANLATSGDQILWWRRDRFSAEEPVLLSWLIDRSVYWMAA